MRLCVKLNAQQGVAQQQRQLTPLETLAFLLVILLGLRFTAE